MKLYPLRFQTIFKDKIWGGSKLKSVLGKDYGTLPNCGETWEISGVAGNISVVSEGPLQGTNLQDLLNTYRDQLVGKQVWDVYGNEFPLLIKFIDANDDLSIQVHPGDELARKRHNCFGKSEMWYILQADEGSKLNTGFVSDISQEEYLEHLQQNTLDRILNFETVRKGDVFYLPAGRVHYIGKGILLAEIQQSSDITYRIYDFDRKDDKGNKRDLHTELALDAIDFKAYPDYKTTYSSTENESTTLVKSPYFQTNLLVLNGSVKRDFRALDSMVIYVCLEGNAVLEGEFGSLSLALGDSILVPASIKEWTLKGEARLLEVYIP